MNKQPTLEIKNCQVAAEEEEEDVKEEVEEEVEEEEEDEETFEMHLL